jgi:hypothetical protein
VTDTDASRCGSGGGACAACGSDEACSPGGCVASACAESCDGCCRPDGTCDEGFYDDSCGWGGEACVHCAARFQCDQGCRPFVGVDTCDGCYRDGVCLEGHAVDACGDGADTCHDCGAFGLQCESSLEGVLCSVDLEQRYDVYLLSVDVGTTGRTYDAFGGLPDLYVSAHRYYPDATDAADQATSVTTTVDDTLSADWGRFLLFENVTAAQITNLDLTLYDEDTLDDDYVTECFVIFDELHPRLIERLLVNGEVHDCRSTIDPAPGEAIRVQFVRR